jgi:hypothetical protein
VLSEQIDFVIGVDTHAHTHTAAIVTHLGGLVTHLTVTADAAGYQSLLAFAEDAAPGRRLWAIEGTAASAPG